METQFSQLPINQKNTKVKINIELTSEINIIPFVARQKANVYLLTHLGNLLWADEPKLVVNETNQRWRIPIIYTIPERRHRQVGELAKDINTGEIILHESNPPSLKEIEEHVQQIYQNHSENTSL